MRVHWYADCPAGVDADEFDELTENPRRVTCIDCIERANR